MLQELPEQLGGAAALQTLKLQKCKKLARLPAALGRLEALQELVLAKCPALHSLPEGGCVPRPRASSAA